jgi:fluoride exporter
MGDLGVRLLLVATGGALGAICRYLVGIAAVMAFGVRFPAGTLIVNAAGCLGAGVVIAMVSGAEPALSANQRLLIMTGFLGGLTTFSAFSAETMYLAQQEQWGRAALNIGANVALSLAAVWAGWMLARSLHA